MTNSRVEKTKVSAVDKCNGNTMNHIMRARDERIGVKFARNRSRLNDDLMIHVRKTAQCRKTVLIVTRMFQVHCGEQHIDEAQKDTQRSKTVLSVRTSFADNGSLAKRTLAPTAEMASIQCDG